jgi:hypothetical protein
MDVSSSQDVKEVEMYVVWTFARSVYIPNFAWYPVMLVLKKNYKKVCYKTTFLLDVITDNFLEAQNVSFEL